MWPEPLTTTIRAITPHRFRALVLDGDGQTVARVDCAINEARCGAFGAMRIDSDAGAPRQRLRALVLLVRASLAHAAAAGVVHVETRAPAPMADFAARMTGFAGAPRPDGALRFAGDLGKIRTHALDTTDVNGDLRS